MTPAQLKALQDYQDTIAKYQNGGHKNAAVAGARTTEDLGPSAMSGVETDPQFKGNELEALKQLEQQSQQGLTDRDRADMAQTEMQANRANAGRIGAIKQGMAAHGMGGSGMDMVAQMQSAQSANELQAMKALETAGMASDRRTAGTQGMANLAGRMDSADFEKQAAKARAQDAIAQFNNQNRNNANAWNTQNAQNVSNMNTSGANQFAAQSMDAGLKGAGMGYNASTQDENMRLAAELERRKQQAAKSHAMGQVAGTVIGGALGTFAAPGIGTAAGAEMGGELGGGAADASGGYWHGGKIPGKATVPGDSPANDTVLTPMSPGEVVVPRTVVAAHHDVIGHLLDAASKLHKARK